MHSDLAVRAVTLSRRTPLAVSVLALAFFLAAPASRADDFGGRPSHAGIATDAPLLRLPSGRGDSAAVAEVVREFGRRIAAGDSAGAAALLASDAIVIESGGVESREGYISHHLPEDIAFRKAVPAADVTFGITVHGDVAWAYSTNISRGQFESRAVNSAGAELMVLSRRKKSKGRVPGWEIRAVHWSSRRITK